jgi:hypothetical protein
MNFSNWRAAPIDPITKLPKENASFQYKLDD